MSSSSNMNLYGDFKARVLKPVKAEFDKKYQQKELDLTFDFEENKEARKVVGLLLEIQKLPYITLEREEKADTTSWETGDEELVEKLLEMKLSRRQAQSRVKKYPSERILRNIELVKQKDAEGEVNNVPAFLIEAIENDYAKDNRPSHSAKSATLRAEARRCWSESAGSCGARWSKYKDDRTEACYFCAKFEKQRSLNYS